VGRNFNEMGYGYQWWSARAGHHPFNLAWAHGGQQIVLVDEFDMVIVVKTDPLFGQHGGGPWSHEKVQHPAEAVMDKGSEVPAGPGATGPFSESADRPDPCPFRRLPCS
jgi:hypothetical protein